MDSYEVLAGLAGVGGILLIILALVLIAFAVVYLIACWKLYKKAGKNGWECIVPVYSYLVLADIAGLEWWWGLLAIANVLVSFIGIDALSSVASIVSFLATLNIYYNIALRFNKNKGNAVCAGIFSGIFVLIFGFSKNEVYNANIPVSKYGLFGHPENNNNNNAYNPNGAAQYQAPVNNYNGYNQNGVVQPQQPVNNYNGYNQNGVVQPQQPINNYNGYNQNNVVQPQQPNNINQGSSFCTNCGTKLDKSTRFCTGCGKENIQ